MDRASSSRVSDGTVQCWGSSTYGQLGYGNQNTIGDNELPSAVGPVSVSSSPGAFVTALDTGVAHTCALLSDHTVKCWGFGVNGALGYGNQNTIGDNELPSSVGPVSISNAPGVTVTALALGAFHSCALLSDGTVTCWGDAHDGEPGAGNTNRIGDDELPSSVGPVVLF
ncbi:MAG TPA: hypothetical protein VNW92_21165 [Polyangiaceae bacterium]|jgi:hypothetical protein|nr:hypothetical protein [Polyangiaceae bacterium]